MLSPKHKIEIETAFSEKIKNSFASLLPYAKQRKIVKGAFIVEKNEICTKIFLVQDGIFRTFRELNTNEYTTGFSFEGDFETSPFSFFYEMPSTETIQAITDAVVMVIDKQDFWEATKNNDSLQKGVHLLLVDYIEILENRLHQNRSMTAEAQYLQFLETRQEEAKKIPLGYIASFLGITRERLSRIRKKIPN